MSENKYDERAVIKNVQLLNWLQYGLWFSLKLISKDPLKYGILK